MDRPKKLKGRPLLASGLRNKKIDARFTQDEFDQILVLEKELGIRRTDLIRIMVLHNSKNLVINARDLIAQLDLIGTELGRSGNNINQLAKYANTLSKQGVLSAVIAERYNDLLHQYNTHQTALEVVLRKIIRQMAK